jgi:hypothetical protein
MRRARRFTKLKRKRLRAYLSGGMEYAANEGVDWRNEIHEWIRKTLGHAVFNPNHESERYLARKLPAGNLRELKFRDVETFTKIVRGIVQLDSKEVAERSDYVLCYWDKSAQLGAGTKGELTLARFFGKPVYMVTSMKMEEIPGWVLGCVTHIFSSFSELKLFLFKTYTKKRK